VGLLRAHWIVGPPFVDRKSLATMSNGGSWWVTNVVDFVFKTLSPMGSKLPKTVLGSIITPLG